MMRLAAVLRDGAMVAQRPPLMTFESGRIGLDSLPGLLHGGLYPGGLVRPGVYGLWPSESQAVGGYPGGTSLYGGAGSVIKTLAGALLLFTLTNGFNILDLGANYQGLIEGSVLVGAAAIYTLGGKARRRNRPVVAGRTPLTKEAV